MDPWAIILITLSVGLVLFIITFVIKKKKNEKRSNPVMFTNTQSIPSTNTSRAPAYNMGTPPTQYQTYSTTVIAQPVYPNQQYPPGVHQGFHAQGYPPQGQIYHPSQGQGYPQQQEPFFPPMQSQSHQGAALPLPTPHPMFNNSRY